MSEHISLLMTGSENDADRLYLFGQQTSRHSRNPYINDHLGIAKLCDAVTSRIWAKRAAP